jgi:predicted RNA polymerase sigma factor
VEAAIAATHCCAARAEETDWGKIVWLYDKLMAIRPSPVIALNRAIAIAQHEGPARGLEEIHSIENSERIAAYPFYAAAIGELEFRRGRRVVAGKYFRDALALARSPMEKRFLEQRVRDSGQRGPSRAAKADR